MDCRFSIVPHHGGVRLWSGAATAENGVDSGLFDSVVEPRGVQGGERTNRHQVLLQGNWLR